MPRDFAQEIADRLGVSIDELDFSPQERDQWRWWVVSQLATYDDGVWSIVLPHATPFLGEDFAANIDEIMGVPFSAPEPS